MTMTSLEVAKEWYAAVHAGDPERLFSYIDPDCSIEYYGPSVIPFAGIYKGIEKCQVFFGHVANDVEIQEFLQEDFIADGEKVAVTGHLRMVLKATGRLYSSDYAHILTVRNGKVVRFRDFQDTAQALHVSLNLETPIR
ncbi:nuclear transport factor 2 family protein [Hirschia baltica]|uniref:SnoaL-like domain-containing protein n=1 Tax=Hirschia baltica (strain ATCC 49814 / DSM 5838 / IFAM 1418) TaxID=582402 RepID=C6XNX3_HIRBI|nr:nuclear transport factor 2 family protein [Hirschia baltica]ACT60153.1 conserved hypothetical protein [Hirschia baltica ATCC 49814]